MAYARPLRTGEGEFVLPGRREGSGSGPITGRSQLHGKKFKKGDRSASAVQERAAKRKEKMKMRGTYNYAGGKPKPASATSRATMHMMALGGKKKRGYKTSHK